MPLSLVDSTPDTAAPLLSESPAEPEPVTPRFVVVEAEARATAQAVVVALSTVQTARELTHKAQTVAGRDLFDNKSKHNANAARLPDSADASVEPIKSSANPAMSDEQSEIENLKLKIEWAGVEQARRVADCLRVAHELTLTHMAQPCLTLSGEGDVTFWNPALARWLLLPAAPPDNSVLTDIAEPKTVHVLAEGLNRLADQVAVSGRNAAASPFVLNRSLPFRNGQVAMRVTFVPLCRIPGCLESAVVLVEPAPV